LWILDTDHVSLVLRGHPKVVDRLGRFSTQISTTIITVQEIFNGWVGELNQPNANRETILEQCLFNGLLSMKAGGISWAVRKQ
jgi:tRNA(fMet)-specific endonuclease VapC